MTDGDGLTPRGDLVTHRLTSGEIEEDVARRLTKRVRFMVRGDDLGGSEGAQVVSSSAIKE
jgi:hypothetical protein